MPSLEPYRNELDYSYAPGIFPAMECLLHRPESVRRLLVHSVAAGRDGIEKLTALAETENAPAYLDKAAQIEKLLLGEA